MTEQALLTRMRPLIDAIGARDVRVIVNESTPDRVVFFFDASRDRYLIVFAEPRKLGDQVFVYVNERLRIDHRYPLDRAVLRGALAAFDFLAEEQSGGD